MNSIRPVLLFSSVVFLACSSNGGHDIDTPGKERGRRPADLNALARSLTFHASFDNGPDAAFALGDPTLYSATKVVAQKPVASEPGLGTPPIAIASGQGKFGDALEFTPENSHVVFYKAAKNVAYSAENFSGTLSFWLKLDPQEIPQTYTDPIQLGDKDYASSSIWIDFTKNDTPSDFRLGIFGDQKVWDKKNLKGASEEFFWRLLKVVKPGFSSDRWRHVVVTWEGINTDQIARGKLFFDGVLQGETGKITEPFIWDVPEATIRLGTGPFVGMFDDIAIFDRSLTDEEVRDLHDLGNGVADLTAEAAFSDE